MKSDMRRISVCVAAVALRGRAWIEIFCNRLNDKITNVALRGRAWIEMGISIGIFSGIHVALRGRAWIEISAWSSQRNKCFVSPSAGGRGLKSSRMGHFKLVVCRPPREGVD